MADIEALDSHFHMWELDRFKYAYPSADQSAVNRNILIEEYEAQLSKTPITQGIFVQVAADYPLEEAEWVLDVAKKNKNRTIAGIVSGFKLDDPKLEDILERFSKEKLFLGVRNILEFEPEGYLLKDESLRGFSKLVDRNVPFCLLINSAEMRDPLQQIMKLFPQHHCVVDHMGKPYIDPGAWDEWITGLSRYPNVYCKLSSQFFTMDGGLTANQKAGKFSDQDRKWINRCLELFGVDRCMFGSDWPVCTLSGITSIKELYGVADNLLSHLTAEERNKIFRGNAVKFFNIDDKR